MQWISLVSTAADLERAADEVATELRRRLDGRAPDLAVTFASAHHAERFARLPALLRERAGARLLVGCSAGGVIGGGREIEDEPGLALLAAVLPDVALTGFHLDADGVPDAAADAGVWQAAVGVHAVDEPQFILLADPFTCDVEALLGGLDRTFPGSRKIGGLASGARQPGGNALYLDAAVHRSGAIGVALAGNVALDTIVAQGCRPIGEPMFVTGCQHDLLRQLDGRSPVAALQELYERLNARDRELFRHSLFLGIGMRDRREEYRQGDFLIRNIVAVDGPSGALRIGAVLREGAVVQFHLRDAETSSEDLTAMLARYRASAVAEHLAEGALLFSCLGRGAHLYGRPDHDSRLFARSLGDVPLGGFFCNGEIGPVHGTTFLHGYTSAFGIFRPRS